MRRGLVVYAGVFLVVASLVVGAGDGGVSLAAGPAVARVCDIQRLKVVDVDGRSAPADVVHVDVAVIGGSLGGVAAAMAACRAGRSVCLAEETDWLGGQATSQAVTALDENFLIETSGGTRSYQAFRNGIRDAYRREAKLTAAAAANPRFSPGRGWTRLGFEPVVAVRVIDRMLAAFREKGQLQVVKRCKAYAVGRQGDRVTHVDMVDLDSGRRWRVRAQMFIDATELGDLLALGAADFVAGAESKAQTQEPHALAQSDPEDVQSFTYCFVVEHCPGERHVIERPADYERNRREQPYTLTVNYPDGRKLTYGVFEKRAGMPGSFWTYRRMIDATQFDDPRYRHDLSMMNWSGNDYRGGSILVDSPEEQIAQLRAAQDLSQGLLYWFQTEVPRDEGNGTGYPEFKLRPDVTDTPHGLAKFPYIRESRRILAIKTIVEQEVTAPDRPGRRAVHYDDSVGIGLYGLDLHDSKRRSSPRFSPAKPFQIPLGALIPRTTVNLLAGCKNIGTTHITNGCYRLHPVEWAIGEAAGLTAALSVEWHLWPGQIREQTARLRTLQRELVAGGAPIFWYDDVATDDPRFAELQMLPFDQPAILKQLPNGLHAPSTQPTGAK